MQRGLPEFLKTGTVLLEKPSTQFGFHLPEKVWNSKKLERRQVSYKLEVENFQSLAILIILHVTGCHFEMRKICHIAHIFSWKKSCYTCKHFFAVSLEFPNWYWDAFSPLFVVSPYLQLDIWNKVSKNASSKICGNQPLKKLLRQTISLQSFWRHKFYLLHSWILCPIYSKKKECFAAENWSHESPSAGNIEKEGNH